jgi:hypothetical protein
MPGIVKTTGIGTSTGSEAGACPACDGIGWLPEAEDDAL